VFLTLALLATAALWWLRAEHHPPQAQLATALTVLGRTTPIDIDVRCDAPGLRSLLVRVQGAGPGSAPTAFDLFTETYPVPSWLERGVTEKHVHVEPDLLQLKVPEGAVTLEVVAETYGWQLFPKKPVVLLAVPLAVDLTPPRLELLTTQHNMRLGGVDLAVFRQSPDTVDSGIAVDKYFFPATAGYFADHSVALAFFAIPQDLGADVHPRLVARDAAGNRREVGLPCTIKPRQFSERTLAVDDAFLARKVPELEQQSGLPPQADMVKGYLAINGTLRQQNEARIREITAHSLPEWQADGVFHRQPNAAPLSSFADRRTYTYHGEVIDHQTHLGFDLASLKLSPVEAAQNGTVVFAAALGIYGNTVIVDHGLGIFSLYGHLSTIAVQPGERVRTAQSLGQTGETGLAAGDHLHFSIVLHGVHVDPVEWWDPHWLRDHVTPKLTLFPRATAVAHLEKPQAGKEEDHEQSQP